METTSYTLRTMHTLNLCKDASIGSNAPAHCGPRFRPLTVGRVPLRTYREAIVCLFDKMIDMHLGCVMSSKE